MGRYKWIWALLDISLPLNLSERQFPMEGEASSPAAWLRAGVRSRPNKQYPKCAWGISECLRQNGFTKSANGQEAVLCILSI